MDEKNLLSLVEASTTEDAVVDGNSGVGVDELRDLQSAQLGSTETRINIT
jgi:hypothetical protein